MSINTIGDVTGLAFPPQGWVEVGNQLMAKQVKVYPL